MLSTDLNYNIIEGECYADVLPFVTSANILCTTPAFAQAAVRLARKNCLCIGALLSADEATLSPQAPQDALRASILFQLGALDALCRADGFRLRRLRLHGALAEAAIQDRTVADTIVDAASRVNPALLLLTPLRSTLRAAARMRGLRIVLEYDVGRGYLPDGSYAPSDRIDAQFTDAEEGAQRILYMATHGFVPDVYGQRLELYGASTHISTLEMAEAAYRVIADSPVLLAAR